MDKQEKFDLRDIRNPNWLWARRELIRSHGEELGPYGVAVYVALASFADTETQSRSRPSLRKIADLLGCSVTKVREAIQTLDSLGWIGYKSREREDGSQTSHQFFLLSCPTSDPYNRTPPPPPSHSEGDPPHILEGAPSHSEGHGEKEKGREREQGEKGLQTNQPSNHETGPGSEDERPEWLVGRKKDLFESLAGRGVSESQALNLLAEYDPDRVARQLRHYETKLGRGESVGPGLLVELIREDPPAYQGSGKPDTWDPDEHPDNSDVDPSRYRHLIPGTEEYREHHRNDHEPTE